MYTLKYKFNGADIVATAKYEAPTGLPLEGGELCLCQSISAEGMNMTFPMLLGVNPYNASVEDYQTAAMSYGYLFIVDKHKITGDMTYSDDENNSSVYPRALQSENAQNAVSVEISAIEPFAEVVADKVKNPLTIGNVVFDGSAAKTVAVPIIKQTTLSSSNVVTTTSPFVFRVADTDVKQTSYVKVYPNDENTVLAFNNLASKLVSSFEGAFEFSLTSNTITNLNITYEILEVTE